MGALPPERERSARVVRHAWLRLAPKNPRARCDHRHRAAASPLKWRCQLRERRRSESRLLPPLRAFAPGIPEALEIADKGRRKVTVSLFPGVYRHIGPEHIERFLNDPNRLAVT